MKENYLSPTIKITGLGYILCPSVELYRLTFPPITGT